MVQATFLPVGGVQPFNGVTYSSYVNAFTFAAWYKAMFASVAFSERLIVATSGGVAGFFSYFTPVAGDYFALECGTTLNQAQSVEGQLGREFQVPWSDSARFWNGTGQQNDGGSGARYNIAWVSSDSNTDKFVYPPAIFYALGDDIRVGRFAQTPQVVFPTGTITLPTDLIGFWQSPV